MSENGMMDFADGWSAEDTDALRAQIVGEPAGVTRTEFDEEAARRFGPPMVAVDVSATGATGVAYYTPGDTPAFRRTGITDRQAAGVDRMPPWANTARHPSGLNSHGAWDAPSVHADAFDNDTANGRSEDGS